MSFGGSKNPPWQRNNMQNSQQQNMPNMQNQMGLLNPQLVGFQQNQQQYNQNMNMPQQQNMSMMSHMGGNISNQLPQNQMFSQAVTYPTPRSLNSLPFPPPQHPPPQMQQSNSQNSHQQSSQGNQSHNMQNQSSLHANLQANLQKNIRIYSGTGMVSKIQNDFGFIEDEIYFHKSVCVKGGIPKVGDRVLVEANYNQSMPFKWNASRIQLIAPAPNSQRNYPPALTSIKTSGFNAVPPPTGGNSSENGNYRDRSNRNRNASPRRSPDRHQRSRDSRKDADVSYFYFIYFENV